jgi:hypothetical protein
MHKGISSKKDYKHRRELKYLSNLDIAKEQRELISRLDKEVRDLNSSPYILSGPKLLKSGKIDRKALPTTAD